MRLTGRIGRSNPVLNSLPCVSPMQRHMAIFRHLDRSFVDLVQHDCGHNCNICNINSETNCVLFMRLVI